MENYRSHGNHYPKYIEENMAAAESGVGYMPMYRWSSCRNNTAKVNKIQFTKSPNLSCYIFLCYTTYKVVFKNTLNCYYYERSSRSGKENKENNIIKNKIEELRLLLRN
jgi:hypothetical protein